MSAFELTCATPRLSGTQRFELLAPETTRRSHQGICLIRELTFGTAWRKVDVLLGA
jgi:hypothetical protein